MKGVKLREQITATHKALISTIVLPGSRYAMNIEQRTSQEAKDLNIFLAYIPALLSDIPQAFLAAAGWLPVIFLSPAGLDLPKDPLKIFPFLVFLSPLPMIVFFS